jgi:hypothetical protein
LEAWDGPEIVEEVREGGVAETDATQLGAVAEGGAKTQADFAHTRAGQSPVVPLGDSGSGCPSDASQDGIGDRRGFWQGGSGLGYVWAGGGERLL